MIIERERGTTVALSERAQRFRDATEASYNLRPDEGLLLDEICEEITLIDTQGAKIKNMRGTPDPRLLEALQRHRGLLSRLIRQLGLKDTNGASASQSEKTTSNARKAAAARWGNRG